ncbi:hypothetical protein Ciccas_008634, partial [Cichlidogyrus casuarinus]
PFEQSQTFSAGIITKLEKSNEKLLLSKTMFKVPGSRKKRLLLGIILVTVFFFLLTRLEREEKPTHLDITRGTKKYHFASDKSDAVSELGWNLIIKNATFSHVKNLVSFANGEEYQLTNNFSLSELRNKNSAVNSVADYKIHASYLGDFSELEFSKCMSKVKINQLRKDLIMIFKKWMQVIEKSDVVWWMWYGSLLASVRNQDVNPWEYDADICVSQEFKSLLRSPQFSERAKKLGLVIRTRPGEKCKMLDCNGTPTDKYALCSFCGPIGRMYLPEAEKKTKTGYVDIYLCGYHMKNANEKLSIFNEGTGEAMYKNPQPTTNLDDLFPLHLCSFIELKLPCPRNPLTILEDLFGANLMAPDKICSPSTRSFVDKLNNIRNDGFLLLYYQILKKLYPT